MGEAEISKLKAKCNALIDEALQKKKELEELDSKIEQLQETKKSMEERLENEICQVEQESQNEGMESERTEEESELQKIESQEKFSENYNQILQMLQEISQTQTRSVQEDARTVRKVSSKEKIRTTIRSILSKAGKVFVMLFFTAVLSLAATIAINENLRNMFVDILRACFG